MTRQKILPFLKQLRRPVFTTHEIAMLSSKSLSTTTQSLKYLQKQGVIFKIRHGIWGEVDNPQLSPYSIIPFLFPRQRVYVSFISALHLYGIIEQIPQVITLASTAHSRIIRTKLATFQIHQLTSRLFTGFDWYQGTNSFLIAEPEKALMDCLYVSCCRKKHFRYFPEMYFPKSFDWQKTKSWLRYIINPKVKKNMQKKLESLGTILTQKGSLNAEE